MPESIIKKYYDGLRDRKLIGIKCRKCGKYTFPPTSACEHCGSFDFDWVEMSGKAKLLLVSHNITPAPNPRFTPIAPYAYGHVQLEEGVFIQAIISDIPVDIKVLKEYFDKGPIDVIADFREIDGIPFLAFKTSG